MSIVITGEIRKQKNQDFEPIVKVKIGKKEEFDFLVDTGAGPIVMSASTLDRLADEVKSIDLFRSSEEKTTIKTVGGDVDVHVYCGWVELKGRDPLYKEIYGIIGPAEQTQPLLGRSVLKEFTTVLERDNRIQLEC